MKVLFFGGTIRELPPAFAESGIVVEWPDIQSRHGHDMRVISALEKRLRRGVFSVLVLWTGQVGHSSANFLAEAANKMQVPVLRRARASNMGLADVLVQLVAYKRTITELLGPCEEETTCGHFCTLTLGHNGECQWSNTGCDFTRDT